MKYFAFLAAMVLVFLPPIAMAADPVVIQTDKGDCFLISQNSEGLPVFIKVRFVRLDGSTDVPIIPAEPDTPVIPETKFGLSQLAFDESIKLPESDRAKIGKMVYAYEVPLENSSVTSHQELVDATYERIKLILGDSKGEWPKWYETVNSKLAELERDGRLRKMEEWRAAWKEIAAGLEAAK